VDPYMRGRMRDPSTPSYSQQFELGQPGDGAGIVKVLRTETPKYKVGDQLSTVVQWRGYQVLPEHAAGTVIQNPFNIPLSAYLGVAGGTGLTAFYGLRTYGKMQPGETIFISTAAGAVGSIAVQLAKFAGLKVIGSTGDDAKVQFLKEELGADIAFNYKTQSVWDVLKEHGPIDIYFDNVGGEQLDAALFHASQKGARIILCGYASEYNRGDKERYGIKHLGQGIQKALSINGFQVLQLLAQYGKKPFIEEYLPLLRDNKLKWKEHRTSGLENLPEGLVSLLRGQNDGKAVIVVAED